MIKFHNKGNIAMAKLDYMFKEGMITGVECDKLKSQITSDEESVLKTIKEIESLKELLNNCSITVDEYDEMKRDLIG